MTSSGYFAAASGIVFAAILIGGFLGRVKPSLLIAAIGLPLTMYSCATSDTVRQEYAREQAEKKAKDDADRTPRVISEADGCKVYAFRSGALWHYFTRCPDSRTTTDTTIEYQVQTRNGKTTTTTTKQRVESITTEGAQQ